MKENGDSCNRMLGGSDEKEYRALRRKSRSTK